MSGGPIQVARRGFLLCSVGMLAACPVISAPSGFRIATTELVLTQTALALGLSPIAVGNAPLYRRLVDGPALPSTVADLGPLNEPNLELLYYLKPDLIFAASWQRVSQGALERIAKVIWLDSIALDGKPLANAYRLAERIGAESGHLAEASALQQRAGRAFAGARLAGRSRRIVYVVRFLDYGRHLAAFGTGSLVAEVLAEIGLENGWTARSNVFGGAFVGIERLMEEPDATVLSFGRVGDDSAGSIAALADNPLWRAMPFVAAGRVFAMEPFFPAGGVPSAIRLAQGIVTALTSGNAHD